jgi:hypothetical protein
MALNENVKPIWLASYPKSGNTWTRLFFTALLKETVNINDIQTDGIISARNIIDSQLGIDSSDITEKDFLKYRTRIYHSWCESHVQKEYLLMKVHDACVREGYVLFPPEITRGTVYILRNPFDMVASTANHHNVSNEKAVQMICSNLHALASPGNKLNIQVSQYLGTWSYHLQSWENVHRDNMLLIRYEDMKSQPLETFSKLVNYIGLDYTSDQISKAIDEVSFSKIQQQENEKAFKEAPKNTKQFFRSGKVGGWRDEITEDQIKLIIDSNYQSLLKHGYISKEGEVLV